jgi:hypothetical protein
MVAQKILILFVEVQVLMGLFAPRCFSEQVFK